MGMKFWLFYILVAAGAGTLVWRFAPTLGERLPEGVRANICETVDSVNEWLATKVPGVAKWLATSASAPERRTTSARPPAEGEGLATSASAPERRATSARPPAEGGELATSAGAPAVRRTDPANAKWGVLTCITAVETLDGKPFGNVAGGRFLKIEKAVPDATGAKVVGTFMQQKKILHPVRVPAENVLCFTGEPGLLSSNQLVSLRAYYELAGEAEKTKKDILDKARMNAPYLQEAARALKELRAKEETAKRLKESADGDTLRKMTYEISQLRVKVQELNQKYKEWKSTHNVEMPDPEQDPAYRKIIKRRESYVEAIKGLVF